MRIFSNLNGKTFKRELAVAMLAFWTVVTYRVFWELDAEMIGALGTAYGTASTSIWLYVAAAFGIDAWAKQVRRAGADAPSARDKDRVF